MCTIGSTGWPASAKPRRQNRGENSLTRNAIANLERAFAFLLEHDQQAAVASAAAIREAVGMLTRHPLIGRRSDGELRELVISFGKTGYVALYRFLPAQDQIRILAVRHQRELDYPA